MTINDWLSHAQRELEVAGVETARLDVLVLLSDVVSRDKSWVLAHPEHILQGSEIKILNNLIVQRATHVPLAYLRGTSEFYGHEFMVTKHVLVPRPESESIITLLTDYLERAGAAKSVVDVGTGTGALAVTAKLLFPALPVFGLDIDEMCLVIAQKNANKLGADVSFMRSNLLASLEDVSDAVLLANLPYVPEGLKVNTAATHEPKHALYSGSDGLEHYTRLFHEIAARSDKPAAVITESLGAQHNAVAELAHHAGYSLVATLGLAQLLVCVAKSPID